MKKLLSISCLFLLCFANKGMAKHYTDLMPPAVKSQVQQGIDCWGKGDTQCLSYYHKALLAAQKNSLATAVVAAELARAMIRSGALDSGLYYINDAQQKANRQPKGDTLTEVFKAEIYSILGMAAYYKSDLQAALQHSLDGADILEIYGTKEQLIYVKINIAAVYAQLENREKAIEYNLYAYCELKKLNISTHRSKIVSNLATVYFDNQQFDSALVWGRMAIHLGKEFSYINSEIMGNYIVGACMEKNNKLDSAVYFITEAIKLAKANDRIDLQASAQQVLGNVLLSKGHYQEALKNFQEALPIQQEMEDISGYNQSQRGIGLAALGLKNYPLAATNLASYVQIHDSLLSSENRKIVSELNTKYETEKKEKLIAEKELLLLKKNAQIRQSILAGIILALGLIIFWVQYRRAQKAKLKKLAQEKEIAVLKAWMNGEERERNRISQELHDGVAAMLGAAKLNLQSIPHLPEEKKQVQYDKIATILDNTHSDVRRIAHNLLPITLQQEGLIAAIQQFARDLNVTGIIEVMVIDELQAELMLNKQTQLMLFRIIQELTNNIIKHAQASKATIVFSNEEDTLSVKVSDNGKGFSAIADQDSQGLFSIRERLKSLGGVFDIDSKEGSGTSAVLHIALQKN